MYYLKGKFKGREAETERCLPSTASLPKWPLWLVLGQFKAISFSQVSYGGADVKGLEPSPAAIPGLEAEQLGFRNRYPFEMQVSQVKNYLHAKPYHWNFFGSFLHWYKSNLLIVKCVVSLNAGEICFKYIYLSESGVTRREGESENFDHQFTSQMAAMIRIGPDWSLEFHWSFSCGVLCTWTIYCCFPRCMH